jgi:hypothetical protein
MMKHYLSVLLIAGSTAAWSQSLPFDFESATLGMVGYDNASFTIVNNPSTTGNSSSKVAEIVKTTAGDLWAGGKITNVSSLNFSSASSSVLSMKVYTTEPVGTVIKVKLENPYTSEVDAVTEVSGAWHTLTFDFGIPLPSGSADLVIMPQPFTAGSGNTFYVDDIQQVPGTVLPKRAGLPITFESGTTAGHFFSFESATMEVVANSKLDATNNSPMVGKIVRYLGAPYGGSVITFANNIDFANHPQITMKVWTSAPVGTNVTLKAEKPFWGEERSVQTTKTEEWELLTFDFTNAPTDMPSLALMFDFVAGSSNVGDGTATSTFFFDEIKFANVPLGSDELGELGSIEVYPNPASDRWTLSLTDGQIFQAQIVNLEGRVVDVIEGKGARALEIDATTYASGVYTAKINTSRGQDVVRLVKH